MQGRAVARDTPAPSDTGPHACQAAGPHGPSPPSPQHAPGRRRRAMRCGASWVMRPWLGLRGSSSSTRVSLSGSTTSPGGQPRRRSTSRVAQRAPSPSPACGNPCQGHRARAESGASSARHGHCHPSQRHARRAAWAQILIVAVCHPHFLLLEVTDRQGVHPRPAAASSPCPASAALPQFPPAWCWPLKPKPSEMRANGPSPTSPLSPLLGRMWPAAVTHTGSPYPCPALGEHRGGFPGGRGLPAPAGLSAVPRSHGCPCQT